MLSDAEVVVEVDGTQALERCRRERFDLVLCDVMMPQMGGEEFLQRLSNLWPDAAARVVFMSGGALGASATQLLVRNPVLLKPLAEHLLREVVLAHAPRGAIPSGPARVGT